LKFLIQEPGFFAAICLAGLAFSMPFFIRELQKSKSIKFAYILIIFVHQIVAFLNAYLFAIGKSGMPGATLDAQDFHFVATQMAQNIDYYDQYGRLFSLHEYTKDKQFFRIILATVYKFIGTSHLLGEQISILIFSFSCIVLLKLLKLLEIKNFNCSSLIFFGGLPSVVLFGSVTLRESYEVLFFMLAVYFGIRVTLNHKSRIPCFLLMMTSAFIMGMFHVALMFYAFVLIFILLVWIICLKNCLENIEKFYLISIVVVLVYFICLVLLSKMELGIFIFIKRFFYEINNGTFISSIETFRESRISQSARTNYLLPIDDSSPIKIVFSFINIYSHYLFEPFFSKMRGFYDYIAFAEALMRTFLIITSLLHWWKAAAFQKNILGLMILLYFTITFLWAMGTVNYGTSIRHHVMSWWILTVVGVPSLVQYLRYGTFIACSRKTAHEKNS
jgi:hypothetical protein